MDLITENLTRLRRPQFWVKLFDIAALLAVVVPALALIGGR
jgi:hypothetical protein